MLLGLMTRRLRAMLAHLRGIPLTSAAPSSPPLFDKATLQHLREALGDEAVTRHDRGKVFMVQG